LSLVKRIRFIRPRHMDGFGWRCEIFCALYIYIYISMCLTYILRQMPDNTGCLDRPTVWPWPTAEESQAGVT
jgi:hypothetical protein